MASNGLMVVSILLLLVEWVRAIAENPLAGIAHIGGDPVQPGGEQPQFVGAEPGGEAREEGLLFLRVQFVQRGAALRRRADTLDPCVSLAGPTLHETARFHAIDDARQGCGGDAERGLE